MKAQLFFSMQILALWALIGWVNYPSIENSKENPNEKTAFQDPRTQKPGGNGQNDKTKIILDSDQIFQLCYFRCGDPILAVNQDCFRSCWLYYSNRKP
ncbi:MAG: hypothetical protein IPM48_06660 [Saprospiraceae bacterium]|nr:hypothetical protein [Saprospiraceae bacterium]